MKKCKNGPVNCNKKPYRRRKGIEILFGRPEDWRRIATRDATQSMIFLAAIAPAAIGNFWLCMTISHDRIGPAPRWQVRAIGANKGRMCTIRP